VIKSKTGQTVPEASSVCNDALDFTDLGITPTQLKKHVRMWRQKWALVCKLIIVEGVTFRKESSTMMMDEDKLRAYLMASLWIIALLFYLFIPS
jgi:hypothetical protein